MILSRKRVAGRIPVYPRNTFTFWRSLSIDCFTFGYWILMATFYVNGVLPFHL